ncbi:hypothetical protein ACTWP5_00995 [Streptomyces sp. 4N509B]|uniref:hypothetical protein n=1 Tax=Streptomyces sp. 4N509B TaxID=3457413 RepID=UPI003FD5D814
MGGEQLPGAGSESGGFVALPAGGDRTPDVRGNGRAPVSAGPSSSPAAPIHQPGGFPTDSSRPNRQGCWDRLGPATRGRLREMAGGVIDWWARLEEDDDERPTAFVFGPDGLCKASPTTRDGRPVYLVERLRLDAGAMRRRTFTTGTTTSTVRSRVASRLLGGTPTEPAPSGASETSDASANPLDLSDHARGVLGNFPAEVQDFLQRPFLGDDRRVVADYYYEESVEMASQRLFAVFCLSADRNVTLATGTRTLPRGRSLRNARWEIECYHSVVRTPSRPR